MDANIIVTLGKSTANTNLVPSIIGLIGVVIGALISQLGDFIKFKRDKQLYLLRKKEETYIEMQDALTKFQEKLPYLKGTNKFPKELRIVFNSVRTKATTYASKKICDNFYELITNHFLAEVIGTGKEIDSNKVDKFIGDIRKELGIKD